ncbi:hypothetical protein BC937DRAFT_94435 [Endogone sp. FLAS-F59071]|nr:hypothetical protein BC937DRAFT_94435 [Endogone sp. FLAS-F59071]|eukprot:RUS20769.1 hypothetical protein BC937DRAFT_94435 [Endogone sp. FLAS-F59071]
MTQIAQQPYQNSVSLNLRRQNQRAGGSENAAAAKNDEASTVEGEGEDAAEVKNVEASTVEGEDEDATVVAKGVEATDLPPAPLANSQPNADSKLNSNFRFQTER